MIYFHGEAAKTMQNDPDALRNEVVKLRKALAAEQAGKRVAITNTPKYTCSDRTV